MRENRLIDSHGTLSNFTFENQKQMLAKSREELPVSRPLSFSLLLRREILGSQGGCFEGYTVRTVCIRSYDVCHTRKCYKQQRSDDLVHYEYVIQ
jgi:hypothetical protein